jgi:hypothetical protein
MGCGRDGLHICRINRIEQLAALWPWMKQELIHLRKKNAVRSHWLPEHVRQEIIKGLAGNNLVECFVAHDVRAEAEYARGLLVCYPQVDPFIGLALTWFVWLGVWGPDITDALISEFDDMARARGFTSWEWGTSRKGWARRMEKHGVSLVEYRLVKEL